MSFGDNKGRFQKGSSGNPGGRPAMRRTLATQILTTAEEADHSERANGVVLAQQIWQGLVTGHIELVGGITYDLTVKEWLELVKWAHQHVDGAIHYEVPAEKPQPKRSARSFNADESQEIEQAEALLTAIHATDPVPAHEASPAAELDSDDDYPPYDHEAEYQRLSAEVMARQRETLRDDWMRQMRQNRDSNGYLLPNTVLAAPPDDD